MPGSGILSGRTHYGMAGCGCLSLEGIAESDARAANRRLVVRPGILGNGSEYLRPGEASRLAPHRSGWACFDLPWAEVLPERIHQAQEG